MPEISRLAIVEETAELADAVRVGPFTYVGPHVRIAEGCVIENNATVVGRTAIGPNCRVFPLAVVGAAPQGQDGPGECRIGGDNCIREHVTIYAGADSPTRIGDDNLVMIGSQIGAGATVGDHGIFANFTQIGAGCRIEDYVRTSGFTFVEPGVTVGAYTFTVGYTDVDEAAPPFAMVQGSPLRVRGVNTHNLKRCGFADEDIRALKGAFRELYNGTGGTPAAAVMQEMIRRRPINRYVRELVEFLQRHAAPAGGG